MPLRHFVLLGFLCIAAAGQSGPDQAPQFPDNAAFIRLPMSIRANGPFVEVKANGHGPFLFEVDTGSMTSPLASELAKEMGLSPSASGRMVEITLAGRFSVSIPSDFASFGGLWPLIGRRIYGDIGYGVLKHFVAEFDYQGGSLTLYDPKRYHYSGKGEVFSASLEMGYDPQIEGKLMVAGQPEIPVRFTLDTGAGGTVVSAPIVKAHNLFKVVAAKVPNPGKPMVDGVDGRVFETTTARVDGIKLGKLIIDHPLVALSADTDGPFAGESIGVNLGGNILRRFKLTVDYPHNRVILEPNSQFHDPFPADASGLVLEAAGPQFKRILVHGVVPGSPAAGAGVKESDIITAIDGESTDKYALWQIQDLLKDSDKVRNLTIDRNGARMMIVVKLRPLA